MGSLTVFLRATTFVFLAALASVVAVQLVRGRISLRGLLSTKERADAQAPTGTRNLSPSRIQLLLVTAGVAGYVLVEALRDPGQLAPIPLAVPLLLAASHAAYLARKFNHLILSRKR